jgi:RHS repeat-associated protein
MTAIESSDISKSTNRFTTNTTYNDAGMVIADNKFRSMNFSYDANGRQVNATNTGSSTTATTVYDALGNRVATKVNDSWQFVIYDAFGKLVAEYGTQGEGNGGVSYVLQDWQGSVRASVNANGFIQARFDFSAFGEEISLGVGMRSIEQGYSGDATSRQGYGLTEKDSSGLNHTWFRKQEQRAGRWTSPDPYKGSINIGYPQSFNRYSYVENEPTNFIDPTGLNLELVCQPWHLVYTDGPHRGEHVPGSDFCVWILVNTGSLGNVTIGNTDPISVGDTVLATIVPQQKTDREKYIDECLKSKLAGKIKEAENNVNRDFGTDLKYNIGLGATAGAVLGGLGGNLIADDLGTIVGGAGGAIIGAVGMSQAAILKTSADRVFLEGYKLNNEKDKINAEHPTYDEKAGCEKEATEQGHIL